MMKGRQNTHDWFRSEPAAQASRHDETAALEALKRQAEKRAEQCPADLPENAAETTSEEVRKAIHELRVYQIELEMQNEELRTANKHVDALLARYLDLFNSAPVGYVIVSQTGLLLDVNNTAASMLGLARHLLVMQPIVRFIHKKDQDIYYFHRRLLVSSGEPQECELRLVKNDGTVSWARVHSTITQGAGGQPVYRVMLNDISKRKHTEQALDESEERFHQLFERNQAEQKLHASEERLRLVLQASSIGTFEIDLVTGNGLWNEVEFELLGVKPGEIPASSQSFFSFVHPDDLEAVQARWQEALQIGALDDEFRVVRADGEVRWLAAKGQFIFEASADPEVSSGDRRFLGVNFDITEAKHHEEELRLLNAAVGREKDHLATLVDSISDEIWYADCNKNFTLANPSARQAFNLGGPGNIDVLEFAQRLEVYRSDGSLRPAEDAPPLRALTGEVIRNEAETVRMPSSGELRHRQVSSSPVRDSNGRIIGSVSVVRDITDLKRAEETLQRKHAELLALNEELASFNQVAVGRELRMLELKEEINALCVAGGLPPRYQLDDGEAP